VLIGLENGTRNRTIGYSAVTMAVFRSILKVPLPDGEHELHVVQEDRIDEVLFTLIRYSDEKKSMRLRPTLKMPKREAEKLGKFLLGIREIDDVTTESVTREVTKPGVKPELETNAGKPRDDEK